MLCAVTCLCELSHVDDLTLALFSRQRSSYETATHAAHAIRTSLNRMMDMLGAGDLDSEVANGNLMTYFGVFEQRFRDLMLK